MSLDRIGYIEKLLQKRQIRLSLNNDQLEYEAPKGALTSTIKVLLKNNEEDLKERLRSRLQPSVIIDPAAMPMRSTVLMNEDCLAILKQIPDNSIDCMVTDPPYGLKFMSMDWDGEVPPVAIWNECLRVLRPGAFAFVMASPRQDILCQMGNHLTAAGFKTGFTSLYWTYATGFPKATNVARVIDKKLGFERKIIGKTDYITKPKTEEAKWMEGAYASFDPKPALEVILVAMKPLEKKSYTEQALSNRKGVTWLHDCRIPIIGSDGKADQGRFPANLLVSDDILDYGNITKDGYSRYFSLDAWAKSTLPFLIFPKASRKEKEAGLEEFEERQIKGRDAGQDSRNVSYKIRTNKRKNSHPTVKPIKLMAYLITMESREEDVVLDPFSGSGTTIIAASMLNRKGIGIERDDYYWKIAVARMQHWINQGYPN